MLARQRALRIALAEARDGVLEKREDFSKRIRQYQAADSEPAKTGYAWCNSFVDWCFREARRELKETNRSAFVPTTAALADREGWVVRRPAAGDLVCFQFDDDANLDHIGFVLEVNSDGSIRTVEGNTVGDSGGEGVFVKTRARSLCRVFVRVPGEVPNGTAGAITGRRSETCRPDSSSSGTGSSRSTASSARRRRRPSRRSRGGTILRRPGSRAPRP